MTHSFVRRYPFVSSWLAVVMVGHVGLAAAKLPPPSDEAKARAAEAAAKGAWSDKVSAYKTCAAMDHVAEVYRKDLRRAGRDAPAAMATPPCVDPGPYAAPAAQAPKPLEASGAHSPPETATSPPSSKATAAEIDKGKK